MRVLIACCVILIPAVPRDASAQTPRIEVFGGYSLLPANGDDFPRQTSHGVQIAADLSVTNWMSLFGDVGVHFSTAENLGPSFPGLVAHTRVTELFVGPRFVARSERANVFAHALVGQTIGDAGENFSGFSDSGFAFGGGGGVDVHVTPRVAVRAQFDLFGSFADIVDANTRFAVGIVVR